MDSPLCPPSHLQTKNVNFLSVYIFFKEKKVRNQSREKIHTFLDQKVTLSKNRVVFSNTLYAAFPLLPLLGLGLSFSEDRDFYHRPIDFHHFRAFRGLSTFEVEGPLFSLLFFIFSYT